jgi:hypothetical protein
VSTEEYNPPYFYHTFIVSNNKHMIHLYHIIVDLLQEAEDMQLCNDRFRVLTYRRVD